MSISWTKCLCCSNLSALTWLSKTHIRSPFAARIVSRATLRSRPFVFCIVISPYERSFRPSDSDFISLFRDFLLSLFLTSLSPNGWRYPLVGGTGQRHFSGTNSKPHKLLENAQTPTTTLAPGASAGVAPMLFGDRVHAVLGGISRGVVTHCYGS